MINFINFERSFVMFVYGEKNLKKTGFCAILSFAMRQQTPAHIKIFNALDAICYEFDLSKPIWLDTTIADFKRHAKARFYQDNFVDSIDFDYLEIEVIEE